MQVQCVPTLRDINATQWNGMVKDNHPLLSYAFLFAMEQHGCLTAQSGWQPRYLIVKDNDTLLGAMPLFRKTNSWGEFVFDHAWADAYARYDLKYYPKLVSCIPFTPVLGQKLLSLPGREAELYPVLLEAAMGLSVKRGYSSLHIIFPPETEQQFLKTRKLIARHDCQYHWFNKDYVSFDDFLAALKRKKRKNIRQERRRVQDQGISFRRLDGNTASRNDWQQFHTFYTLIYARKWGAPVFSQAFFESVAATLGNRLILILANQNDKCVAGALMYRSDNTLYGRHWGCLQYHDALHFETCYYQGIDYCIEHGIKIFEPGAQGQHKIARGFEPVLTQSFHYLTDKRFVPAVSQFCKNESAAIYQHINSTKAHTPYK